MDRGDGTSGSDGGGICAGTRAVREEQAFFSSAHEETDVTPGDAGVPTMRLCHVSVFRREIPPKTRLLPGHWLGWLPPAQWPRSTNRPLRQADVDQAVREPGSPLRRQRDARQT